MGGNYPPGTSANDPRAPWNAPDRSHEHDWWESDGPLFEDDAAVFIAKCHYAEGRYGEGWSCEETRTWRCRAERVILHREDAPDVAYLTSAMREVSLGTPTADRIGRAIDAVEQAARNNEHELVAVDPPNDYGDGFVRVRHGDYTVEYQQ